MIFFRFNLLNFTRKKLNINYRSIFLEEEKIEHRINAQMPVLCISTYSEFISPSQNLQFIQVQSLLSILSSITFSNRSKLLAFAIPFSRFVEGTEADPQTTTKTATTNKAKGARFFIIIVVVVCWSVELELELDRTLF